MQKFDITLDIEGVSQTEQFEGRSASQALFIAGVHLGLSFVDNSAAGDFVAALGIDLGAFLDKFSAAVTGNDNTLKWDIAW